MADDWRKESDERIERHRKGSFALTCVYANGRPVAKKTLSVRQRRSAFLFGTCVTSGRLTGADGRNYDRFIVEHFNALVTENALKWYGLERQKDRLTFGAADRIVKFAEANGLALRGHCLFWAKPRFVQKWVQQLPNDELRKRMDRHVREVVPRYRGKLAAWDINNEMLDGSFFKDRLGEGIRAWMFKRTHELDPNTPLFVNEYGIMDSDAKTRRYIELIKGLQARGAPVGGIGVQEHGAAAYANFVRGRPGGRRPRDVWRRLDRLGKLDLPIHITEVSSRAPDAELRADTLEAILRVGYAHPKVEAVLLWGFWAGRHWMGPQAALVDRNWKVNAAGRRVARLLLEDWRTNVEVTTGASGLAKFRGFFGTYEIAATDTAGRKIRGTVELTKDAAAAKVVLKRSAK